MRNDKFQTKQENEMLHLDALRLTFFLLPVEKDSLYSFDLEIRNKIFRATITKQK